MRVLITGMVLLGSALPAADLGGTWMMEQAGRGSFTAQMVSSTDSRKVQNGKMDGDTSKLAGVKLVN